MPALPTADWLAALADMDAAVSAALAGLDSYESRWPEAPPGCEAAPRGNIEARLVGWDERLVAAGRMAEELEREIADGAAAVGRWRGAFTDWRGRIQQPAAPLT